MDYKVNEIFYSLQGEGRWTGTPMVFVRFALCNLRCPFCDTDFSQYRSMTADEILDTVCSLSRRCKRVVLTGGEPSIQADNRLVEALHSNGYIIHIETNGTKALPEGIDWTTLSPKTDWQPQGRVILEKADELKLVYTGQDVEKWASFPAAYRYLQPCSCRNTKEVVTYILSHPHWQLSLQTHKILDIK